MIPLLFHEPMKKIRLAHSALRKRLMHVNLQLLYQCNYRCEICDFWKPAFRDKTTLTAGQVEVISHKLAQIGPQIVSLGGGEPMLHPELPEIVSILTASHFPVMISNGSLVTDQRARELWQAGMIEISVSVDYATPQKHDAQRGFDGAWQRALEALHILQQTRTHPEQRVNMISVIMEDNVADVERLIQHCRELGISYLLTLYSHSRGAKPHQTFTADLGRRLLDLKKRYPEFVALRGYLERFTEAVDNGGVDACQAGRNLCNIDSQGNVTLCIDRLDEPVGNLLTEEMQVIEQRLLNGHQVNQCQDCWTSCRGSIESILYGRDFWGNLWDYYRMTGPRSLSGNS